MTTSRRTFIGKAAAATGAVLAPRSQAQARKRPDRDRRRRNEPLFHDEFKRADRNGWGGPWFNQRFGRSWSIKNKAARYRIRARDNRVNFRPNPVLVLDKDVTDVDLRATVTATNETGRVGLVARASGYADYYAAYLGPTNMLKIARCGHHDADVLAKTRLVFAPGRKYRIRFKVEGTAPVRLRAKVWRERQEEPKAWTIDVTDEGETALAEAGPFGLLFLHAMNRKAVTFRIDDFVARSEESPRKTLPAIAYALVGPPIERGAAIRAVAKTAVPSELSFEYSHEPTFSQSTIVKAGGTGRGETASATLDISGFGRGLPVFWRPIAERGNRRVVGATSNFRTAPARGLPTKFAFGACTKWDMSPRMSFERARAKSPDFYLHQGDFGYVRNHAALHAADSYQDLWVRMLLDPHLRALTSEVPFGFFQDDEDYGKNHADRSSVRKFTIDAFDELHANPRGPYFEFRYSDVAVFVLETRRYCSGKGIAERKRTKLGREQTAWLHRKMGAAANDPGVSMLVVASPESFGSDRSPSSWRQHYSTEWSNLIDFFQSLGPLLIVSGNAHGHRLHEYPQKNLDPEIPRIVEFVSAGTERKTKFSDFSENEFLVREAKGSGFGLVELGPEEPILDLRTRDMQLTAVDSQDGSALWRARYRVIPGVGILPALL